MYTGGIEVSLIVYRWSSDVTDCIQVILRCH